MRFTTHSGHQTRELGEALGRTLSPGDIVLLHGDLGAGKTTLAQGIARGLGTPEDEYVRSPSFTLINEYRGRCPIFHIDLYRLEAMEDIENLGLEEVMSGPGVSIVEWAEKLFADPGEANSIGFGIESRIQVRIEIIGEEDRTIHIQPVNLADPTHPVFSLQ